MNPSRARHLAQPAFFPRRFVFETTVLGELQTSVGDTYGIVIDTAKGALFCTCPFHPKPCMHALALSALFDREGVQIFSPVQELPPWAQALIAGRPAALLPGDNAEQRENTRQKRRHERLERAGAGFDDLETWLLDTLRRGLATSISEDPAFFQQISARLADASMRGLSRNFRLLDPAAPDWAGQALAVMADAALALLAFRRRETLPEALLADLEAFIGIAMPKETVWQQGETLRDVWAIAGVAEEPLENKLMTRRSWLLGAQSKRFALILDFVHGEAGFIPGFEPGTLLEGQLVFYPGAFPQRALVPQELKKLPKRVEKLPGFPTARAMAEAYSAALGKQPWLSPFPAVLNDVTPYAQAGRFGLADAEGFSVPLHSETNGWPVVALGGGRPLTVFGEWDGAALRVLSAVAEGRFVAF